MPLPKGGGFFALWRLLNRVGHLPECGGGGGTWGKRGARVGQRENVPRDEGRLQIKVGLFYLSTAEADI